MISKLTSLTWRHHYAVSFRYMELPPAFEYEDDEADSGDEWYDTRPPFQLLFTFYAPHAYAVVEVESEPEP